MHVTCVINDFEMGGDDSGLSGWTLNVITRVLLIRSNEEEGNVMMEAGGEKAM